MKENSFACHYPKPFRAPAESSFENQLADGYSTLSTTKMLMAPFCFFT